MSQPYTDEDVETTARTLAATRGDECFDFDGPQWDGTKEIHRMDARAVLGALAVAGRLRSTQKTAHRRMPEGGWPDGGKVTDRAHTCASCGDDIWPGEHVYPADASGDTSDAAGVQCAVCEVQTRDAYEGSQP